MGRFVKVENEGGSVKYCKDTVTGNYYPPTPCPPRGVGRVIKRGASSPRNFVDFKSLTAPKTIVPVGIGAVAGGFLGNYGAKKIKLDFLGKYNKPAMIIAGALVGAFVGKYIADKMEARNVATIVEKDSVTANQNGMEKIQDAALVIQ